MPRSTPKPVRPPRRGFTLVEMLVATALCGFLLIALWELYDTYAKLFDRGQVRVERAQICRAIMQQIADDLRSAIQDPVPGRELPPPAGAPLRRFSFSGSAHELRMDVLQITPEQGAAVSFAAPNAPAPLPEEGRTGPRVPELRTIFYSFVDANTPDATATTPAGLTRRELDFETPAAPADASAPPGAAIPPPAASGSAANVAADPRMTWAPEVAGLEFRYYDGSSWSGEWHSIQRKALPAAVEVILRIRKVDEDAAVEPPPTESPASPPEEPLDMETTAPAPPAAPVFEYRMTVDLPGSPTYRRPKPKAEAAPAAAAPPVFEVPRIAPPRWTPPSAKPQPLPEEWLRTRTP